MKIFSSGSCRLLTTINNGHGLVTPIHSMFYNFVGINFLGKLHNTKQHLQFLDYLKEDIPSSIKSSFFVSYSTNLPQCWVFEDISQNETKRESILNQIDECDWHIFEICSLKLYTKDNYAVQYELTNDYEYSEQSKEDLLIDLQKIRDRVKGKILFQCHFRPNIIYNDPSRMIQKREIIYETLKYFCGQTPNTYLYDPSVFLQENLHLFDGDTHFTLDGHHESFKYMYDHYLS